MSKVKLDDYGREVNSGDVKTLPTGFKRPETLAEQVQRLVRTHISMQAQEAGFETFEDSEDFDVDDDLDFSTPYETEFDPVLGREVTPHDFRINMDRYKAEYLQRQKEADDAADLERFVRDAGPAKPTGSVDPDLSKDPVPKAD